MDLVKTLREQKGWSQDDLADVAKVGKRTIQRIEMGQVNPSPETAMALADALGVTPGELTRYSGLRARLRTLLMKWQRQPPSPEELEGLPDDLKSQFTTFYDGIAQFKTDDDELMSIQAECQSLHDEWLRLMNEDATARFSILAASDRDTKLRLLHDMRERATMLEKNSGQCAEISRRLIERAQVHLVRVADLVEVACKLDAVLDAQDVYV